MSGGQYSSELERGEETLVAFLKTRMGNDVRVEGQPDDPENFDMAGSGQAVLVHYAASKPAGSAVHLQGSVIFAVICLARELRGASGGYALVENVERALAGAQIGGMRECAVARSRLESQSGGLWRWVVEVETEMQRGAVAAQAEPFIHTFEEDKS